MIIGWFFLGGCDAGRKTPKEKVAAVIGSHQIHQDEYQWKLKSLRTACLDHFTQKYGHFSGRDFWEHNFVGKIPKVWLQDTTLKALKIDYARLEAMQEQGVLKGYCFDSLKVWWRRNSDERKRSLTAGGLVYGNVRMDLNTFYNDLMSKSWLETERRMLGRIRFSSDSVLNLYNRKKYAWFRMKPTIVVKLIYKDRKGTETTTPKVVFDPANAKSDELKWGNIYQEAMSLTTKGQRSGWFSNGESGEWMVLCTGVSSHGFLSFNESMPILEKFLVDERLNARVQALN